MKHAAYVLIGLLLCIIPGVANADCDSQGFETLGAVNCGDGVSGMHRHAEFDAGTSVSSTRIGQVEIFQSNRKELSGTRLNFENFAISRYDDGLSGLHTRAGNIQVDSFNDGLTCITTNLGSTSITNCN